LPSPQVSSRHCELELQGGYWLARDLGSKNGTRVNHALCTSPQWLLPDDILAVAVQRFRAAYSAPAGKPPPPREGPASQAGPAPRGGNLPAPTAATELLGTLIPCGGGQPIPLTRPMLVIGRDPTCDIVLRAGAVSGRHCILEFQNGTWRVRDLGSRHGTRVNGAACEEKDLAPGSILWIAGQRYQVSYGGPGATPAAAPTGKRFSQSLLEAAGLARWQPEEEHK
jgi:adenylate cyclase